ncbi:hypothetical protein IHEIED_04595 [Methylorubrum populi]
MGSTGPGRFEAQSFARRLGRRKAGFTLRVSPDGSQSHFFQRKST